MPAGRPTKYDPKFCDLLIEHLGQGLSYFSFGAVAGACDDTLHEWEKVHPEFSEAKKEGRKKQALFYEKLGINGINGKIDKFNSTAFVWMTKNMLNWRDRQDLQLSNKDGEVFRTSNDINLLTDAELKERLKAILEKP